MGRVPLFETASYVKAWPFYSEMWVFDAVPEELAAISHHADPHGCQRPVSKTNHCMLPVPYMPSEGYSSKTPRPADAPLLRLSSSAMSRQNIVAILKKRMARIGLSETSFSGHRFEERRSTTRRRPRYAGWEHPKAGAMDLQRLETLLHHYTGAAIRPQPFPERQSLGVKGDCTSTYKSKQVSKRSWRRQDRTFERIWRVPFLPYWDHQG